MDKWGDYNLEEGHQCHISDDGVVEAIRKNSPAITSVMAWLDGLHAVTPRMDYAAAGHAMGSANCVEHLALTVWPEHPEIEVQLQEFLFGLASNQSIKALAIDLGEWQFNWQFGGIRDIWWWQFDLSPTINALFGGLKQLFQNNKCLESLQIRMREQYSASFEAVGSAIMACQALKSITLSFEGVETGGYNLGNLVQVICGSKHLKHITFHTCPLSEDDCIRIKNLLSSETCKLESLSLIYIDVGYAALDHLTCGLACNKSVKCLKVLAGEEEYDYYFLSSLAKCSETSVFNVTEVLQLLGSYYIDYHADLSKLLKRMPKLKCLDIEKVFLASDWGSDSDESDSDELEDGEFDCYRDIFFHLPSSLEELRITNCLLEDNDVLDSLVSFLRTKASTTTRKINPRDFSLYLANSSPLKRLDLSGNCALEDWQWTRFLNSLHHLKLEEINLLHTNHVTPNSSIGTGSPVLAAVTSFLTCNKKLKVLKLPYFGRGAPAQWEAFSSVLESHPCLEELEIESYGIRNDDQFIVRGDSLGFDRLTNAIASNRKLKKVRTDIYSFGQFKSICRSIKRPDCMIEELAADYYAPLVSKVKLLLIKSLRKNVSLQTLRLNNKTEKAFDLGRWGYLRILCDQSSVNKTYTSNHTLQTLFAFDKKRNNVELHLLHANKGSNKHLVAREKIIQYHTFENVNFVPSSIPIVMSWVGNATSNKHLKLSQMYSIVRKVPHMFQHKQKKRKFRY